MKKTSYYPLIFLALVAGCIKKEIQITPAAGSIPPAEETLDNLTVSPYFQFKTDKTVDIKLTTLDNNDKPVGKIRVNVYNDFPGNGGRLISSVMTGSIGDFSGKLNIPARLDSLVLETRSIGFVAWQKRPIAVGQFHVVLGGKDPWKYGKATFPASQSAEPPVGNRQKFFQSVALLGSNQSASNFISPIGTFNMLGVPDYLATPNDVIDHAMLNEVNNALPEGRSVSSVHPQFLTPTNQSNLEFKSPSQVWVTFLHEGAANNNVLCYYKYNTGNPPLSVNDVDTLHVIFPNVSYVNSGGGLISGNKVSLGNFTAGQSIGWALIANGYNANNISTGSEVYYSNTALNPESIESLKKHSILLNDIQRGKFLLSFEDMNREKGSDHDFNDAIFLVTAAPTGSVNTTNIPPANYNNVDTDKDGVADNLDDYPQDPTKAFDNYYPAKNTVGAFGFEDQWPSIGDYDFNDMVIDYNFNTITNAQNQVVEIEGTFITKAVGASFHNGFGIQLPISPSLVAKVTGTDLRRSLVSIGSNGTELGQSKATIIIFDDGFDQLPWPGSGIGTNTMSGLPYVQPRTLQILIKLTSPVSPSVVGEPPFNPFIFINRTRGREVHLIDHEPTDLADKSLFKTKDDNSILSAGRYYMTVNHLPFAIDVVDPFDYVKEKTIITLGHLKFKSWALSNGNTYRDWYKPMPGYRNDAYIYRR
jgi:LruC domain-containing protein